MNIAFTEITISQIFHSLHWNRRHLHTKTHFDRKTLHAPIQTSWQMSKKPLAPEVNSPLFPSYDFRAILLPYLELHNVIESHGDALELHLQSRQCGWKSVKQNWDWRTMFWNIVKIECRWYRWECWSFCPTGVGILFVLLLGILE